MGLEIYDCTLREGEQAGGVVFSIENRLEIAKKLDEFGIEFIELGWPIHPEVLEAFLSAEKSGLKAKIVAFGSTSLTNSPEDDKNLNSIIESRAKYACIFGKTWLEHVKMQLKISKEENLNKIYSSVKFLKEHGIDVFYDAEHYFDGFKSNPEYALKTIEKAAEAGASRIILCDTNGGCLSEEIKDILIKTKKFIEEKNLIVRLGIHVHNDSGLAFANSLEALNYVEHVQGTINGLGERVGNLDLCEFIPLLMLKKNLKLNFKLEKLKALSDFVYRCADLPQKINQAFISERAFSHKGGVHIDATMKGASYNHVTPSIFGLDTHLILTSLGGAACVVSAANKFGFNLDKKNPETMKKIMQILDYLRESEKEGYDLGNIDAEQQMIIEKYFGNFYNYFEVEKWKVTTDREKSMCELKLKIEGKSVDCFEEISGGPINAIYNSMKKALSKVYPQVNNLKLEDYMVRIARSDGAQSKVRTRINFSDAASFSTVGLSRNILESGLEALKKAFNYYLNINKA